MEHFDNTHFLSSIEDWLQEVATSKILTIWEPEIKSLNNVYPGKLRYISRLLSQSKDDNFYKFPNKYNLNTTLAGAWSYLSKEHQREYLITVFGQRLGSGLKRPASFEGYHISFGDSSRVNFSPQCIDYFDKHISTVKNADILIFHNHPINFATNILSQIIDWNPLPSNADRTTMLNFKFKSIANWLLSGNLKNVRFLLVEQSRLSEISLPPISLMMNLFKAGIRAMRSNA